MSQIEVVKSIGVLREKIGPLKEAGKRIGLVATMGALHKGHLSLAQLSKQQADCTVATIFVNPAQFAPGEDLDQYPRSLESDLEQLQRLGVDYAFVPERSEVYPPGCSTMVQPPAVATPLEGEYRPAFFWGVCTVVLKLFNIVQPDVSFFGEKDFQQLASIRQMVKDLHLSIEIVAGPTVRDPDGLALSSRNQYLSTAEREIALSLNRTIKMAIEEITAGENDGHVLMAQMRQSLIDAGVSSVDYAVVCRPENLEVMDQIQTPAVVLIAAHVGKTRLIDNGLVN